MVTCPTRITASTSNILDLFLTNNASLVNKCEVIPGLSDHETVYVEASLRPMSKKKLPRKVFLHNKADYAKIKDDLRIFASGFDDRTKDMHAEDTWELFLEAFNTTVDKNIPSKIVRGNKIHKPWIDKEVKTHMKKRDRLYKRYQKYGTAEDREGYLKARAETQRVERKAYWKHLETLIEEGDDTDTQQHTKQQRFWKYISSLKKDNTGIAPLKENGKLHQEPEEKANILNRQYQSVFTDEDKSHIPEPSGTTYQSMPDIDITVEGVCKLLRNLNPRKASGPDQVPARLLKEMADELAPILTVIFKKCLTYGETPHIWLSANVTAIFKKGDRFKASNYRPVSLTCLICKVLEHIVVSNVMKHLDNHQILTDCQHGFRARRSCETQLISLIHELASSLDSKKQHDIAVLDFSKAFDRVPHERLLAKLHHYGVRGNTHRRIRSFLTDRSQRVVVDGAFSAPVPVVSGVPQGSVLGPILFLVFINDLLDCVASRTRLFADDCVLYREINSTDDCDILQQDLVHLEEWERKWGMDFHPDKCSILRVHRKKDPLLHNYSLKGHILTSEQHTMYLGVIISQDLTWTAHINSTVKKANSVLGFLRRNLRVSNEHTKEAAYKTLVRPHLEYCCTIWNPHTKELKHRVEMVQRRAARFTTRRYRNTSSVSEMLDHLCWETLESRRTKSSLTMLYKVVNDLVDIPASTYLTPGSSRTRSSHSLKFRQCQCSLNSFKYSFFQVTVIHWNSLPATVAEAPDLVSFKRGLSALTF